MRFGNDPLRGGDGYNRSYTRIIGSVEASKFFAFGRNRITATLGVRGAARSPPRSTCRERINRHTPTRHSNTSPQPGSAATRQSATAASSGNCGPGLYAEASLKRYIGEGTTPTCSKAPTAAGSRSAPKFFSDTPNSLSTHADIQENTPRGGSGDNRFCTASAASPAARLRRGDRRPSYEEARRQVDDYAAEIGKSGLEVHFVIDRTGQPDSLRQVSARGAAESPDRGAPCSSATSR